MDTTRQAPRPKKPESGLEPELPNWMKMFFYIVDGRYIVKVIRQIVYVFSIISAIFLLSSNSIDLKKMSIFKRLSGLLEEKLSKLPEEKKNEHNVNQDLQKQVEQLIEKQQKLHPGTPLYVVIAREGDELNQIAYDSNKNPIYIRQLNSHIVDDKKIIAGVTPIVIPARCWMINTTTGSLDYIAKKYHVSLQLLLDANYLKIDYSNAGSRILVPYQHGIRYRNVTVSAI